jgi:uncharacterized OB-fold protein
MGYQLENVFSLISDERPRIWRYSYSAGPVRSKFLFHLRDKQMIIGTKCPTCRMVYVPARSTCIKCYEDMEEWVEISNEGTLETYTIVYEPQPIYHTDPPFAIGIIKLDGADTGLVHRLREVDYKKIHIGMRVKAVFEDEVKGDIRDIKYFEPI